MTTRTSITKPLLAAKKAVDDLFAPVLKPLKEAEGILKRKLSAYVDAISKHRVETMGAMGAAGSQEDRDALALQLADLEVPVVAGVSVLTAWTGEVMNEQDIPREYLMPNMKMLEDVTKAMGTDPNIPGWRAYPETSLRVSRK